MAYKHKRQRLTHSLDQSSIFTFEPGRTRKTKLGPSWRELATLTRLLIARSVAKMILGTQVTCDSIHRLGHRRSFFAVMSKDMEKSCHDTLKEMG